MTSAAIPSPNDARYHAIKPTATWKSFEAGMAADVQRSAEARKARDAKRQRETTYARGELGGH